MTRYRVKIATWTIVREDGVQDPKDISSPVAAADLARDLIPDDGREHSWGFYLNRHNRLLFAHEISVGTASETLVHPREVFGPALRGGASAIIVAHNHPGGSLTPSRDDRLLTRKLKDAGGIVGVELYDHVIITHDRPGYWSFAEHGGLNREDATI